MNWEKQGKIEIKNWACKNPYTTEFAILPTPLVLNDDVIRIYIGFCNSDNVGSISYIDVNAEKPSEILDISSIPVLTQGREGCFDDNGVVPLSVLRVEERIFLYYVGFQLGVKIPYFMFGGLAVSNDGGNTFERISETPILDRKNDELFARCGMNVMKSDNPSEGFKMWYIGTVGEGWAKNGNMLKPLYTMRYTHSDDGINWNYNSEVCMTFENSDEHGFGRPFVWIEDNKYKMLYSVRTYSRGYFIGYAESDDEIHWIRKDGLAGISVSDKGWDCENISYPVIVSSKKQKYLFYNGNGCGRDGFGYAVLV